MVGGGGYSGGTGGENTSHAYGGGGGSYYLSFGTNYGSAIAGYQSMPAPDGGTETGHYGNGRARITPLN